MIFHMMTFIEQCKINLLLLLNLNKYLQKIYKIKKQE